MPDTSSHLLALNVEYSDGDPEIYLAPISMAVGEKAEAILRDHPNAVLARLEGFGEQVSAVLFAATMDRDFSDALLRAIVRRKRIRGESGELVGAHTREFRQAWTSAKSNLEPTPQQTDQCFTVINYGTDFVLKLYRKLEEGINPGTRGPRVPVRANFLQGDTAGSGFARLPEVSSEDVVVGQTCVGTLISHVPNATGGWRYTLDHLGLFFEHALAIPHDDTRIHDLMDPALLQPINDPVPQIIAELLGSYLDSVRLLARRTAELHAALSSRSDIPEFAPEPFTTFYRQGVYHGMLGQLNRSFELLRSRVRGLPAEAQSDINEVLNREGEIRQHLLALRDKRMSGNRIRCHGDYHLSNVLFAGSDWLITNFEGDFSRSLSERRIKRSALRDVATMLRSFHYVSHAALFGDVPGIVPSREAHPQLEKWAKTWNRWVGTIFLRDYLQAAAAAPFLPQQADEFNILLGAYMIERALMEIEYELEQRPAWIRIPVHGMLGQLKAT